MSNESRPTFYYVYDALCGWCYGFSPVMKSFYEAHKTEFNFEVVSGGMVMGERAGPIGQVAAYIKDAFHKVEERSGVKFGKAFLEGMLEEGTANFSSLQPAVALSVFKSFDAERQVEFAHDIQSMVYSDGIAPDQIDHYAEMGTRYGIDRFAFAEAMGKEAFIQAAFGDFETAQQLDVTGFPTSFLYHNDTFYKVTHGYCDLATLEMRVDRVLNPPVEDPA